MPTREPSSSGPAEWQTSTTLLGQLRDRGDSAAWFYLVGVFQPLLVRHACRQGFSLADGEEIAQRTLAEFSRSYVAGAYQAERGRLRDWLFGIARNQARGMRKELNRASRDGIPRPGTTGEEEPFTIDERWNEDWKDAVLRMCMERIAREVEPRTYEAFICFAVKGEAAEQVAATLGMTENAVFLAKRRILELIRAHVAQLETEL